MKKNLLAVMVCLVMVVVGCVPYNQTIERKEHFTAFDLKVYTDKGFLFTTENYGGEYDAISLIDYEEKAGAKYNKGKFMWEYDAILLNKALSKIMDKCVLMGANGVIGLKTTWESVSPVTPTPSLKITGLAIKRK